MEWNVELGYSAEKCLHTIKGVVYEVYSVECVLHRVVSPQSVFSAELWLCRVGLCRVVPPQRVASGYSAEH